MFSVRGRSGYTGPKSKASRSSIGAGSLQCSAPFWPGQTDDHERWGPPRPSRSWSLCLLTLPEGRFQTETRVHHKCINMSKRDHLKLCFITLELAAVIWNEWWVWVSGLRMAKFSLIYIIFGLDHSLLCFLTFLLAQSWLIPIQLPISE